MKHKFFSFFNLKYFEIIKKIKIVRFINNSGFKNLEISELKYAIDFISYLMIIFLTVLTRISNAS